MLISDIDSILITLFEIRSNKLIKMKNTNSFTDLLYSFLLQIS